MLWRDCGFLLCLPALFLAACAPRLSAPAPVPAAPAEEVRPAPPLEPIAAPLPPPLSPPEAPPPLPEPTPPTPAATVASEEPGASAEATPPPVPVEAASLPAPAPDEVPPPAPAPPAEAGYESAATYYAKRFNGRPTITDEIYDPDLMTAATNDLPLGTLARVVNPKNGREVIVRINDRPRKRNFPLIDLSRAAAKQLGFFGKGKIKVRVIPLPPEAPEYKTWGKKKKGKKSG